ncbi:mitochondrial fission regulator 2 isoform X2 [Salmo salar]|uniref:Mitochondrial fission regulator n=1 Tax=Salmo salar TaxID=8030 RepID=A0ABM3F1I1_SALSA|nr:mitochondrial fission regulator 2 isoform X2 [Salmo salar]
MVQSETGRPRPAPPPVYFPHSSSAKHTEGLPKMSLLEDIIDLLQNVLEYFGVSPDMLVPVWETQLCGQYRSLVRMIGTNLPLTPSPRIHFQIPQHTSRQLRYLDVTVDTRPAIPSLADVLWVAEDEGDGFTKIRHRERPSRQGSVSRGDEVVLSLPPPGDPWLAAVRAQPRDMTLGHRSDPVALRKITALEDELLKLRAQIAMIVTAPPSGPANSQNLPGTPGMSPASFLTSTPCYPPPPPPPPCCPPPPPPPPCPLPPSSSVGLSEAVDLIQQGRESGKGHAQGKSHEAGQVGLLQSQDKAVGQGPVLTMLDVLNDLNQVKLRSVERSPGGTPVRRRRSKGTALLSDPASMIAEALRRKFAHHRLNDSYDKENRSSELSPFGSPDTSPCHSKRSQGRLDL